MSTKEGEETNSIDADNVPAGNAPTPTRTVSLSVSATLELLASRKRRMVLEFLREMPDDTATVAELAEHLRQSGDESTDGTCQNISMMLTHAHLPKLEDASVIEREGRTVQYRRSDRLDDWLLRVRAEETN
ncbi:DUF7344 domain-containing protein [Haladaptatus halobius]|uniref:DUF7344 domain-containing protein n=1 Tax=Haladaptatus halobius TaxID=2884875 RepID=UPI001D0ACFD5|nr:hypothetical protein [Haladaptatus halobius]